MQTAPKSHPAPYDGPIAVHGLGVVGKGVVVGAVHRCDNAMPCCCNIAATRLLRSGCAVCSLWRLAVLARPLVFDDGGARGSPKRSNSLVGALHDPRE